MELDARHMYIYSLLLAFPFFKILPPSIYDCGQKTRTFGKVSWFLIAVG